MAKIPVGEVLSEAVKGAVRGAVMPEGEDYSYKSKPGETWANPLDETHPDVNRFFLMNFASATPETMGRKLAENFEVKHRGGLNFSIRKPGEEKWKVVDRKSLTDWIPFYGGDWSDILGDIFTGIGSVAGTLVTAPGLITTPAGAAAGAAAAETVKQGIGKLLGSGVTPEEAAKSVAFEGAAGAVGEVGGRLLAPLIKGGLKATRRGLLGNASEVAERNAAKLAEYERTLATAAPIRAIAPEGMGVKEQVKQGYMTLAEAATEAANRGDEKLAEWVMKQEPRNLSLTRAALEKPELERPSYGLFGALARKGEKAADALALAETRGMKEFLDTPDEVLRQQAADIGVATTRKTTAEEVREAIVAQHESSVKEGIKAAKAELDRANNILTRTVGEKGPKVLSRKQALRAGEAKTAKETAERKLVDLKAMLKAGPAKTAAELIEKSERIAQEINSGGLDEAQRLGIVLDRPKAEIAQEMFKAQSPAKISAVRGQIDRAMEEIAPDQRFEADYVAQQASKEGRGPAGAERTFKGTQRAPLDEEAYRTAVAEAEGLSVSELQSLLRRSGWEGPLAQDRDQLVFNLYETKFGKTGVGSPESLTGPEFLTSLYNVESKRKGFNPMETIRKENISEIRAGGKLTQTGREALEPSRLRSAALAVRPLARGVGKAAEVLGSVLEAPSRGVAAAAKRLAPRWVEQFVRTPEREVFTGLVGGGFGGIPGGGALVAIGGAGIAGKGLKKLGHAIAADNSGQMLVRLASKAPRDIAEKLLTPLQAKAERGTLAYKAAVFTLFHQADARQWLDAQEKGS